MELSFVLEKLDKNIFNSKSNNFLLAASQFRLGRLLDGRNLFGNAFFGSVYSLKNFKHFNKYNLILDGYFQDPYFCLSLSTWNNLRAQLLKHYEYLLEKFNADNRVCVGLHIRRGDFVSSTSAAKVFRTIDLSYYREAVSQFPSDTFFMVFGDDEFLTSSFSKEIGGINVSSLKLSLPEEFMLLASCDHYVIANSTFSWWAASMGSNIKKRVYSPRSWYVDKNRNQNNPLLLDTFQLIDND
jgi:hypothetical protein